MWKHNRFSFLILGALIAIPAVSSAQAVITEVMYDLAEGSDSGKEWIEVHNTGASPIALTDWTVFENGKNHKITMVAGGATLAPAAYAVVADNAQKFKTDHPEYTGQLFDSVFSLNNDGESIALRDKAGAESDSVAYASSMGGNGTGGSLQKIDFAAGAAFSAGIPTPGTGVPAGGLVRTPPKEKKTAAKKASTKSVKASPRGAANAEPTIVGNAANASHAESQVAAAALADEPGRMPLWWLGTAAIAGIGAAGAGLARRARKTEWDIIEETDETR